MAKFIFVYVTCPNKKTANKIGFALVKNNLAACVNILSPMSSIYSWKGKINTASETVLIIKATQKNYTRIEKAILELHPYECPCVVALPVTAGYKKYLNWLTEVR